MAARINIKNIDYFKYKKLIIDANRDDYGACSKEVKAFCDCVQTLQFRDEEFDDELDRGRFAEICGHYQQILASKRIDPVDMRIKSGWWGEHKNAYSAGKLKPAALREKLVLKTSDYNSRHGNSLTSTDEISEKLDGPGLYVFKHKEHQCFQYVGRAAKIINRAAEKLKAAFEGSSQEPLSALLIISMSTDWDFYFIPVEPSDGEEVLRILENDLILKHDSIWPYGLNFRLHIDSLLEVSEFRKSCLRHHWPPDMDSPVKDDIDIQQVRLGLESSAFEPICSPEPVIPKPNAKADKKKPAPKKPPPEKPAKLWEPAEPIEAFRPPSPLPEPADEVADAVQERAESPTMSTISSSTFVVSEMTACTERTIQPSARAEKRAALGPRPSSAGRPGAGRGSAAATQRATKSATEAKAAGDVTRSPAKQPIKSKAGPTSRTGTATRGSNGSKPLTRSADRAVRPAMPKGGGARGANTAASASKIPRSPQSQTCPQGHSLDGSTEVSPDASSAALTEGCDDFAESADLELQKDNLGGDLERTPSGSSLSSGRMSRGDSAPTSPKKCPPGSAQKLASAASRDSRLPISAK